MTNGIVHRGADALGEALIAQRRRDTAMLYGVVMHQCIDIVCGHACLDIFRNHIQNCRIQLACLADAFQLLGGFNQLMTGNGNMF